MIVTTQGVSPCLLIKNEERIRQERSADQKKPNRVEQRVFRAAKEALSPHAKPQKIKSKTAAIVASLEETALKAIKGRNALEMADALLEEFSLTELQRAIKKKYPEYSSLRSLTALLAESASRIPDQEPKESPLSSILKLCKTIIRKILQILDAALSASGIEDLFTHVDNEFHASHKLQKILLLLSILTSLLTLFAINSLSLETALVIGAAILAAAGLSAIYIRYLKPAPLTLPCARNLCEEALSVNFKPVHQRGSLDLLAAHLEEEGELKRPLLLTGPRGVGKTLLIEDLAKAICSGMYPKLAGKQIFYFNTADLIATSYSGGIWGDGDRVLQKIVDSIGRHGDETVIVFDDIHTACKPGENYYFSDRLKSYLGSKGKGFSHFIAVASSEEYSQVILESDPGFDNKFKKIRLESAGKEETIACLKDKLIRMPSTVLLEEGALEFLDEKVRESDYLSRRPQPLASLLILNQCLQALDLSWKPSGLPEKSRLQEEKTLLLKDNALTYGRVGKTFKRWEAIESSLKEIETLIERQDAQLSKLLQSKQKLDVASKALFELASRLSKVEDDSLFQKQERDLKKLLFLVGFYIPTLEMRLERKAKPIGAEIKLSKELILREIHQEEQLMKKLEDSKIAYLR